MGGGGGGESAQSATTSESPEVLAASTSAALSDPMSEPPRVLPYAGATAANRLCAAPSRLKHAKSTFRCDGLSPSSMLGIERTRSYQRAVRGGTHEITEHEGKGAESDPRKLTAREKSISSRSTKSPKLIVDVLK